MLGYFSPALVICSVAILCGDRTASAQTDARDSAGVLIITARVAGNEAARTWKLTSPMLSIGNEGGDERYTLDAVVDAIRLEDGRIVVAEGRVNRLRVYSASGEHVADWGRSGDGPGEFRGIWALHRYRGDSILVAGVGARRLSILDANGRFGRAVLPQLADAFAQLSAGETFASEACCRPVGALTDGSLVVALPEMVSTTGAGPRRAQGALHRTSPEGESGRLIGTFEGATFVPVPEIRSRVHAINLAGRLAYVAGEDRIHVGDGDGGIRILDGDGQVRMLLRTDVRRRAVDSRMRDAEIRQYRALATPGALAFDRASLPFADSVPEDVPYLVDAAGRLWTIDQPVGRDPARRLRVFERDGSFAGTFLQPPRFYVFDAGRDWVLIMRLDDLDVQRIELYSLRSFN
jgi:hypothetical protein